MDRLHTGDRRDTPGRRGTTPRPRTLALLAAAATVGGTLALAPSASALDPVDSSALRSAVTVNGILSHERVLQRIANQNGGTRASGTPGFAASAAYVKSRLSAAGYRVREQTFTFAFYRELAPAVLTRTAPDPAAIETATFDYSASGDVTGRLVPTKDVVLPPSDTVSSTSGCELSDYVPAGAAPAVALVQRGTCTFEQKAANAAAAGYDAVLIFNEGQEGRQELLTGTLGNPSTVPVAGLSFADGRALFSQVAAGPVTVRLVTSTEVDPGRTTSNILADTPGGDPSKVVVVGSHLDSVLAGPGINDNGSGTATDLEVALQMARLGITPKNKVRFAFWGAEEAGLLGSEHYVDTLSDLDLSRIYANLNFDMLASPNFARFVYDGDGSAGAAGPAGSGAIEKVFTRYFASQDLPSEPTDFDGRSDYGPFIAVGIPAGGLFSGAEGVKTAQQAHRYGGVAGEAYDSCYHQACDTTDNLSIRSLRQMSDAVAHAVLTLATSPTDVFGERRTASSVAAARAAAPQSSYKGPHLVR